MTSEVLPPLERRLGYALAHDAQSPVRMLSAVVGSLPGEDPDGPMMAAATAGLQRIDEVVTELAAALRVELSLDGATDAATLEALARREFARLGGDPGCLTVRTATVALPETMVGHVVVDLFAHALAGATETPRRVDLCVDDDGDLEIVDDGPAPTTSPAGPVRPVHESTGRSMFVAQRVASARGGAVSVEPVDGAVRVRVALRPTGES